MTVGILVLLILGAACVVFFGGGQIAKRLINGYWGPTTSHLDMGWFGGGWLAIAATAAALGFLGLAASIGSAVITLWNTPL